MTKYVQRFPVFYPATFRLPGYASDRPVQVVAADVAEKALATKGGQCGCCGQTVKVYRRSIYKHMARCLIWIVTKYAQNEQDWVNLKEGPVFRGGDNTKLAYWNLTIAHATVENLYKPTQLAVDFVTLGATVPRYAYVYDGQVYGFSQERRAIVDCLKGGFDKQDLTAAIAAWGR